MKLFIYNNFEGKWYKMKKITLEEKLIEVMNIETDLCGHI